MFKNDISVPETKIDHLKFYLANNISPVRQNIDDMDKHLQRRSSLYRNLGVPAILLKDKNILEVGPGSGHNSLYVASCKPKKYDLLEPNRTAQNDIKKLYANVNSDITKPNLIKEKLEDFYPDDKYDIVICEAWIGVSNHERKMMKKLGSLVHGKGILITTIASPLSSVANGIRRILSWKLVNPKDNIKKKTNMLLKAYSSHLSTICDMSRVYEDWVQDTLINPGFLTMCPQPDMFIEDIGSEFEIYESFPKFVSDWRWYKTLYRNKKKFNTNFLEAYHRNIHNFFDYNQILPELDEKTGFALEKESIAFMCKIASKENHDNYVVDSEMIDNIKRIKSLLTAINKFWSDSFDEAIELMQRDTLSIKEISKMHYFNKIFGRELIYVSAIKK